MKYRLEVSEEAENDIESASDWYEQQQTGLGTRFVLTTRKTIRLIIENPFAFAVLYKTIRKANTNKYPYSLYYQTDKKSNTITIIAVLHQSRSNKVWKQRLKK